MSRLCRGPGQIARIGHRTPFRLRLAKAKQAHDDLISAAYRAQANALEIEAQAKRRLADEYDAAQERGEVAKLGDNLPSVPKENSKPIASQVANLPMKKVYHRITYGGLQPAQNMGRFHVLRRGNLFHIGRGFLACRLFRRRRQGPLRWLPTGQP